MNASTTLRSAALAATTLATLGMSAAPASAVTKTLNYQCNWPLAGKLPLKAEIDISASAPTGTESVPALPVTMTLTGGTAEPEDGSTSTWDFAKIIKAVSFETGTYLPSGPTVTISGAELAAPLVRELPLSIENYTLPPTEQDVVLTARTTIPAVEAAGTGTLTYELTTFKLRLSARKADGSLVRLPPRDGQ